MAVDLTLCVSRLCYLFVQQFENNWNAVECITKTASGERSLTIVVACVNYSKCALCNMFARSQIHKHLQRIVAFQWTRNQKKSIRKLSAEESHLFFSCQIQNGASLLGKKNARMQQINTELFSWILIIINANALSKVMRDIIAPKMLKQKRRQRQRKEGNERTKTNRTMRINLINILVVHSRALRTFFHFHFSRLWLLLRLNSRIIIHFVWVYGVA